VKDCEGRTRSSHTLSAPNKASAFRLRLRGRVGGHALKISENHVDLEGLADVPCSLDADAVPSKTTRVKQGATAKSLLTSKRVHFGLRWWERGRALEGGEGLVELEGLADVLGTLIT